MESDNLNQLLQMARQGDRSAFDELFALHQAQLRSFVAMRLDHRVRSRVDVSDVVQDTQLEAYRRFNDYYDRQPMPFGIWLRKNADERVLNVRRDHMVAKCRSMEREQRLDGSPSGLLAKTIAHNLSTPSERVAKLEFHRQVTEVIEMLPDGDREILLMRNVDGLSHQQIAQVLDINATASRKRYARALMKLEKLLVQNGIADEMS